MHKQEAFSKLRYSDEDLKRQIYCVMVLSLPMHPYLDEEDVKSSGCI